MLPNGISQDADSEAGISVQIIVLISIRTQYFDKDNRCVYRRIKSLQNFPPTRAANLLSAPFELTLDPPTYRSFVNVHPFLSAVALGNKYSGGTSQMLTLAKMADEGGKFSSLLGDPADVEELNIEGRFRRRVVPYRNLTDALHVSGFMIATDTFLRVENATGFRNALSNISYMSSKIWSSKEPNLESRAGTLEARFPPFTDPRRGP
ncbi:hypothetical protein C8J56DRAFT_1104597 [Mycena floridula]|nr:hypothetical protein C8J56DRAFT_1104597 [Mycena floridula]